MNNLSSDKIDKISNFKTNNDKLCDLIEYLMHVDLPIRAKGSGCF